MTLFDDTSFAVGPSKAEQAGMTAGARLTLRQKASIARGVHPLTGRTLLDPDWGFSCGDCALLFRLWTKSGRQWKCLRRAAHSTVTDVRISWPACDGFRISDDPAHHRPDSGTEPRTWMSLDSDRRR